MFTRNALRPGDVGIAVNKHQAYLNMFQERGLIKSKITPDGVFGPRTTQAVKEYQKYSGIQEDGLINNDTWNAIVNKLRELNIITNVPVASRTFYLAQGSTGLEVFKMQEYINEIAEMNKCLRPIPVDGTYGTKTTTAVQQFQYLYDLDIDGAIGKATWDAIVNTRNTINK